MPAELSRAWALCWALAPNMVTVYSREQAAHFWSVASVYQREAVRCMGTKLTLLFSPTTHRGSGCIRKAAQILSQELVPSHKFEPQPGFEVC